MPLTVADIGRDALHEIGVLAGAETMTATDGSYVLGKFVRLLNNWNAERRAVYASAFASYTLTPNLSPHTIGPTGATWTAAQRPVSIDGAALILTTSTPNVRIPINLRDAAWWDAQAVPDLTSDVPTDLYYQPDWPNGKLYFWPVPTAAYGVELMTRVLLDETVTLNSAFSLPPGYRDAITLTLAEMLCDPFGVPRSSALERDAKLARSRIFGNNEEPPRIRTTEYGLSSGDHGIRADFNWITGQIV